MTNHRPNWLVKKLGEIAPSIQYGYTESSTLEEVGPKFLRITDIQNGKVDWGSVPYCTCDEISKYRLQPGDILFARTVATTGKSFLITDCPESVFASYLIRVQLSKEAHPGYVYQFFQTPSYWSHVTQFTTGSTQGGFNASKLAEISIPLPPLPIQKQIAAILEKADAAWEKRWQANQLTEQFLQSAFLEMFGDPVTNPKGWEKKPLVELCDNDGDLRCGPFGSQVKIGDYQSAGIPVWDIEDVKAEFKSQPRYRVSPGKAEELSNYYLQAGDIVMTRRATIGISAVYPESAGHGIIHSALLRIRVNPKKVDSIFLSNQLSKSKDVEDQISRFSSGAIFQSINVSKLKAVHILIPPLPEQQKFAVLVEKVEGLRVKQRESEKELEKLFQSLMQRAFNGELVF